MTRILNRKPRPYDHRDYLLSNYITPEMRQATGKMDWAVARVLDQGTTPHCVGYAWAQFGIALPVFDDWQNDMGDKIYYQAKQFDGEPGAEDGSTTLSGVKAFMKFSQLLNNAYAWAGSLDDIVAWILTKGPVVTGTNWYYDMMDPDPQGFLRPTGGIAGGHEWVIPGVDTNLEEFDMVNSWGTYWGNKGHAKIKFADYQYLLNLQGDAVTAVEVSSIPVPTPTPIQPNITVAIKYIKSSNVANAKALKALNG